jgi:hypothetical protein
MIIELDKKSAERLIKLKATSLLSNKEIASLFNISPYRLTKFKKDLGDNIKLSDSDWIYGALRTLNKCTVDEISEYIDYKNKLRLTDKTINRGLEKLINEGHAYKDKARWNYCQRLIEIYSNKTDKFISEIELGFFDLTKFKKLFRLKEWDYLMYEQFDVTESNFTSLKGKVSIDLNFDLYSYYLTCRQGEKE